MELKYLGRRRYNRGNFDFPPLASMISDMENANDPAFRRMLEAHKSGVLVDPETGESISINEDACSLKEMAFLHWSAKQSKFEVSVEVGFGLGMSAAAILAGRDGQHITIDPDLLRGKGELPLRILARSGHTHLRKWSQYALPEIAQNHAGACDLIFIDGGHHFENAMLDFAFSDILCAKGGHIIFDDSYFPAIETVISYIHANRADYEIADLVVGSLTVIRKCEADKRAWSHFRPFRVPKRNDWKRRW